MKTYIRQIPPEAQDSSIYFDFEETTDDLIIFGNDDFQSYTTEKFKRIIEEYFLGWFPGVGHVTNLMADELSDKEHTWQAHTIRGTCQSDWQTIYIRDEAYDPNMVAMYYFNTGLEWIVHDRDFEPEWPEEIQGFGMYTDICPSLKTFADALGVEEEDIVLYEFEGWEKLPIYKEAEV